ncbi:MAG: histidine phosphatase family protein [Pseudomonadota bacterium]
MATIYLIRHGQASFGSDNYDKLSELGCRQAQILGEYLSSIGVQLDAAYCGELQRQRKTAKLALASQSKALEPGIDVRFNEVRNDEQVEALLSQAIERDPALGEVVESGLNSSKAYQKVIEGVFTLWTSPGFEHPGIQSWQDYSSGVIAALRGVMAEQGSGKVSAIFTSGGTIATAVAHVLGVAPELTYRFYEPVINCSITELFYSGDKISLSYFNDHSYLRLKGLDSGEELVTYR